MDTSKNYEPFLNTLSQCGVCQKVSNNFNTTSKALDIGLYFNKSYMWGNGL